MYLIIRGAGGLPGAKNGPPIFWSFKFERLHGAGVRTGRSGRAACADVVGQNGSRSIFKAKCAWRVGGEEVEGKLNIHIAALRVFEQHLIAPGSWRRRGEGDLSAAQPTPPPPPLVPGHPRGCGRSVAVAGLQFSAGSAPNRRRWLQGAHGCELGINLSSGSGGGWGELAAGGGS